MGGGCIMLFGGCMEVGVCYGSGALVWGGALPIVATLAPTPTPTRANAARCAMVGRGGGRW